MKKRILLVKPDGIGDFIIFTAVLEEYRRAFASYEIDILCNPRVKNLAEAIPFIRRVFTFNPYEIKRKKHLLYRLSLKLMLNMQRYDTLIYPVYSRASNVEDFICNIQARQKIVFDGDNSNDVDNKRHSRNHCFNHIIKSTTAPLQEIQRNAEFVNALGGNIDTAALTTKIWFKPHDANEAARILEKYGVHQQQYICIFPGAGHKIRYWPASSWAELIGLFHQHYPQYKIILMGSGSDHEPMEEILTLLDVSTKAHVINLYGETTLRQMAQIIKQARFFVGMDTAAVHMAAAVGTPNICLLGGGHFNQMHTYGRFYPYGDLQKNRMVHHKMPCFDCHWRCIYAESKCISHIRVEEVWHEVQLMLTQEKEAYVS